LKVKMMNSLEHQGVEGQFASDDLSLSYSMWNPAGRVPVIMLHGLNVQRHTWDPIVRSLNADFRVACPDLRGHGDSDWAKKGYPIAGFVDDVDCLADALNLGRFALVGHSLGARIAIAYAGERSSRLSCVALSDTGPELPTSAARSTSNFIGDASNIKGFRNREEVRNHYSKLHPDWLNEFIDLHARYQVRENWAGKLVLKSDPELYWITRSAGVKEIPYLWQMSAAISVPTLIMVGNRSEFFDEQLLARMQATIRHSEVVRFDTGHYIPREKPEEFAIAINEFLQRHGRA
jgi:pimeloyl-ACP methyl ester carboxylesterase